MIEFKTLPKTMATAVKALEKEKDQTRRYGLAMVIDQDLREKPAASDLTVYDPIAHLLIDAALTQMAAPTDIFVWPGGGKPEEGVPRGDILGKGEARILPGRVSKGFHRTYIKTPKGSKVDRGFVGQTSHLNVAVAESDDELFKGLEKGEFWGIALHTIHIDGQFARGGVTFISPATGETPPRRERPAFIGLFRQLKPGLPWTVVSIEPMTVSDLRQQDVNMIAPNSPPGDYEKRLRLAVAMEEVRTINPTRKEFTAEEERIFNLGGVLDAAEVAWLDPYRLSENSMVRAAAELKAVQLGSPTTKTSIEFISKGIKHPVVLKWLNDAKTGADDKLAPVPAPAVDAGK